MNTKRLLSATMILACACFPVVVHAVTGTAITIGGVEALINSVVDSFMKVAGVIVAGFMVYGGIVMATAREDTTQFTNGRKILINAIIGGFIVFGVGVIVNTIAKFAQNPTGEQKVQN